MRPMLKASTALLASLSLLVPSLLGAQTPVIDEQVEAEMPAPSEPAQAEPPIIEQVPAEIIVEDAPEPQPEPPAEVIVEQPETVDPAPVEAPTEPKATIETAPVEAAPVATEGAAISETTPEPSTDMATAPLPDADQVMDLPSDAATEVAPAVEAPAPAEALPASPADNETEALEKALEQAAQNQSAAVESDQQPETDAPVETQTDPKTDAAETAPTEPEPVAAPETNVAPIDLSSEPAPESGAIENDLTREASNPVEPVESDALKAILSNSETDANAATDNSTGGQVSDFTVTEDSTRSSDEDFLTSVARSITGDASPEEKAEAKDNKTRDLARLALAGMAGLAVGKMLSDNREVALNTGDRLVVTLPDGSQQLIKDEDTLLFQPGSNVKTERYDDGSSITTVLREDGSQVVTIRDANMNILRRAVQWPDGRSTMLIDDTGKAEPVVISKLPPPARPVDYSGTLDEQALRDALMRESSIGRHFSLGQIRNIAQVRALVAPLDIQSITFNTGSAAITPDQAAQLSTLGRVIADTIRQNPNEIFMIEGYTDAIGSDASNLALSDRRAESVALALTEYFKVPPENMIVQGYGEQFLRIQTLEAERANRRVAVRRITDLLTQN